LILGRHLLELGLRPGPHFKAILAACSEAQLEGAFTDETGGCEWLGEYLRTHAQGGPTTM
jgi:tRNA nucleotidyltransferase (CCA-adding enzyme)